METRERTVRSNSGKVELTWTNKAARLVTLDPIPEGARYPYCWVTPADYRAAEVRLLDEVERVGDESAGENLLIRGDALHALAALGSPSAGPANLIERVKLAYLDPPFNTGKTFTAYEDNLERSIYLTMMRDRLRQVRRLLRPDGTVWLHCDDSMVGHLRVVMDEVFTESCFVAQVIWRSSDNSNNDAKHLSTDHNYLLVYAASVGWVSERLAPSPEQVSHYANPDDDPRGHWFDGNPVNSPNPRENLRYAITSPTGVEIAPPPNGWRWSRETLDAKLASGEIRFTPDGTGIRRRTYLADHKGLPASSLWVDLAETGHNRQAKSELKRLFPGIATSDLFDTPKPERLLRRILQVATRPGDLVLDCFLGSGTTAAVAHKMGRRWVGVEISHANVGDYALPRLTKVVQAEDPGGITKMERWRGGGGFTVLDVAPSMFTEDAGGRIVLADWAVGGALGEAVATQLGFAAERAGPFCGRKGRTRLAVIDGLVNAAVADLLVEQLDAAELVLVVGTGLDPEVPGHLAQRRPGSMAQLIPQAILNSYGRPGRWTPTLAAAGTA